ncbi:MAG: hypothetical protein LBT98_02050 [Puniceicoccales bacterium]|jgi:1,4-dihydroxy-2-naphthoate octaprenyltransferase|nr:hypothetical protein [Puniceicoccales bacterium]
MELKNFISNVFQNKDREGNASVAVAVAKISSVALIVLGVAAATIAVLALCGIFPLLGAFLASALGMIIVGAIIGTGIVGGMVLLIQTIAYNWHNPVILTSSDWSSS